MFREIKKPLHILYVGHKKNSCLFSFFLLKLNFGALRRRGEGPKNRVSIGSMLHLHPYSINKSSVLRKKESERERKNMKKKVSE